MIKVEIWDENKATATGPFPFPLIKIINALSGRKHWKEVHRCNFEATPNNLKLLQSTDFQIEFIDKTGQLTEQQIIENMPTQHAQPEAIEIEYHPQLPWYDHQSRVIGLSWFREWYALFFDMGLGKTAILIATAGLLYLRGKITGVLIIAPKGVYQQWIEKEIPKHLDKRIIWTGVLWKKKKITDFHIREKKSLTFFSMNTDAVRTHDGVWTAEAFLKAHNGKTLFVVDESDDFKPGSERTRNLLRLGLMASYRRISTGTPITKNPTDFWQQMNFLSEKILGFRYLTAFKQRFCISKPGDHKTIVGSKNMEELYSLIAPHSFRMMQEEALDLPPKIYVEREYDMSPETMKYYKQIKEELLAEMEDGKFVDAVNPAVALLRLQQIVCGFLTRKADDEEGRDVMYHFGGERIEETMEIVRQTSGPFVIWARFIEDRRLLAEALKKEKETFVIYAGTDAERKTAVDDFHNKRVRGFIANQRTGGVGLDGLQGECATVIHYSNSFNARDRWQSEARTTRIGTLGTVTHFDIIARKSVDRTISRNLRVKKDLSDLVLDDIRRAIVEES